MPDTTDGRIAIAVTFGCLGLGAAIVFGVLAVVLARNGGRLPEVKLPKLTVSVARPVPDFIPDSFYPG